MDPVVVIEYRLPSLMSLYLRDPVCSSGLYDVED